MFVEDVLEEYFELERSDGQVASDKSMSVGHAMGLRSIAIANVA
ncbi:MAG: hypothetical protein AAF316_07610 [Cyanobacteria bacterium P01_A01_bin.80]